MSSDFSDETKKMKRQLEQGLAEAEESIHKSKEYLGKYGYGLDSDDLKGMLDNSADPEVKRQHEEYQEKLRQEIEQESGRLQQSRAASANGAPRRKPARGVKI